MCFIGFTGANLCSQATQPHLTFHCPYLNRPSRIVHRHFHLASSSKVQEKEETQVHNSKAARHPRYYCQTHSIRSTPNRSPCFRSLTPESSSLGFISTSRRPSDSGGFRKHPTHQTNTRIEFLSPPSTNHPGQSFSPSLATLFPWNDVFRREGRQG